MEIFYVELPLECRLVC